MSTDELRAWVEEATGGRLTRFERQAGGSSRETWFADVDVGGSVLELVLRRDGGDGPLSGTELDLAREAAVYRSLAGTPVPVPTVHAVAPNGDSVILERVPGRDDFTALEPTEQEQVAAHFVEILAALHGLDVGDLDVPGLSRPETAEEHAWAEIDLWRRIFEAKVKRPEPLVEFALAWLHRHAPATVERTVLVQGDTGPGNFLFEDGRVTAVLDWEFAHLGDPMDDLAWVWMRDFYQPFGDLASHFRRYSELSGVPVDTDRVLYYRALVLTRTTIACLAALDGHGRSMDPATYSTALQLFRRLLCETLAELCAVDVEMAPLPPPRPPTEQSDLFDQVVADLSSVVLPAVDDPVAARRAQGVVALLLHLQAAERSSDDLRQADLDDAASLLGRRPGSPEEATAAVVDLVRSDGGRREADLLGYLTRRAQRTGVLWAPVLGPLASKSFASVTA